MSVKVYYFVHLFIIYLYQLVFISLKALTANAKSLKSLKTIQECQREQNLAMTLNFVIMTSLTLMTSSTLKMLTSSKNNIIIHHLKALITSYEMVIFSITHDHCEQN